MEIFQSKTVGEAFLRRCKADAKKIGFRYKSGGIWHELTFAQQFETVQNLSLGLAENGVKSGKNVGILAQTSLAWGQFDIANLGCKAVSIPIYPTSTPEDMQFILNHAEIEVVFVDDYKNLMKLISIKSNLKTLKKVVINFDLALKEYPSEYEILPWSDLVSAGKKLAKTKAKNFEENLSSAKPDDVFTICYTSGTTGTPKGVILLHTCMASVMEDAYKVMTPAGITENEDLLSFLPMSHIFGKWESMTPYFFGWTQNYAESVEALLNNLQETKPTLWISVPRVYEKAYARIMTTAESSPLLKKKLFAWALETGREHFLAKQAGKRPSIKLEAEYQLAKKLVFSKISAKFGGRLKVASSGSAPLAKNISEFMHIVGVPVFEGYGLTETCAPVSVNMPYANSFGTVGKLLPEVLVRIAEDGEILIKSQKVFRGYYKNDEATKETIKDGWFYTGDIGHLDENAYLRITDRKKDLIKTAGGKFVAPQKIENIAKSSNYISQIVVYGDQKPYIVALITLNQEAIIQYAKEHKILFGEFAELIKKKEIEKLIESTMTEINGKLARYETIKRYKVLPTDFTVEAGELTPSLKVKRKVLSVKYQSELEGLY